MSKGRARKTRKQPGFIWFGAAVALIIVLYAYFAGAFDQPEFPTNTCTSTVGSSVLYCEHNL